MTDNGLDELTWRTPPRWADEVLEDRLALLADHAHLERAAAANALSLVRAFPDDVDPDRWVARLTAVARDEVDHLAEVNRQLAKRGGRLSRSHHNAYARALRLEVATGTASELADRLYVSSLIELRSFERFQLLAGAGHDLSVLYADLEASEAGHYRLFLQLARSVGGTPERWSAWLAIEGAVAHGQEPGSRIHAGVRSLGADDEETVA